MKKMTKDQEEQATEELLLILADHSSGLPTSELIGTRKFHGVNTLTGSQVARLLRSSGKVDERIDGSGKYSRNWWTLKK